MRCLNLLARIDVIKWARFVKNIAVTPQYRKYILDSGHWYLLVEGESIGKHPKVSNQI